MANQNNGSNDQKKEKVECMYCGKMVEKTKAVKQEDKTFCSTKHAEIFQNY